MALPSTYRTNYATRPDATATTNYAAVPGTGGTAALTNSSVTPWTGTTMNRVTWSVATTDATGGVSYTEAGGLIASTTHTHSVYVRSSIAQRVVLTADYRNAANASVNILTGTQTVLAANTWTRLSVSGASGVAVTGVVLTVAAIAGTGGVVWPVNATLDIDGVLIERTASLLAWFSGNTAPDAAAYRMYVWSGTAGASTSREEHYGIYVEITAGSGMGRTTVYAAGLGSTAVNCKITRSVGSLDVWTVPGWRERSVTNADATVDWFVPLGVPVRYTLAVNGQVINSQTITVASTSGWLCDPLQPDQAMPMNTVNSDPATLTLGKATMKGVIYDSDESYERPSGSRYTVARASMRSAGGNVPISWYAHNNSTNDQCRTLIAGAPIILFKPLPSWGAPSSLLYFACPVKEEGLNRDRGGKDTYWSLSGSLVAAVLQPPVSGTPTYDDVKTNIGTRTYASVQSSSGAKRYVDIQATPLGLGS